MKKLFMNNFVPKQTYLLVPLSMNYWQYPCVYMNISHFYDIAGHLSIGVASRNTIV